jgi:hypothetical protein
MKQLFILCFISLMSFSAFGETCTAYLKDRRTGGILNIFRENDYDSRYACGRALERCDQELRWNQNPYGYCELDRDDNGRPYPPPPPRGAVARCDVGLIEYGRIVRGFSATAEDYDYRRAQQIACNQALNVCSRYQGYNQQCRVLGVR